MCIESFWPHWTELSTSNIDEVFNSSSRFMEQVPKTLNERANFFSFLSTYECSLRTFLLWHDPSSKEKSFSWFFEDTTKIVEKGGQEPLRKCGLLVQPMSQWNGKIYRRAFLGLLPMFLVVALKWQKQKDKFDAFVLFGFSHSLWTFEFEKGLG